MSHRHSQTKEAPGWVGSLTEQLPTANPVSHRRIRLRPANGRPHPNGPMARAESDSSTTLRSKNKASSHVLGIVVDTVSPEISTNVRICESDILGRMPKMVSVLSKRSGQARSGSRNEKEEGEKHIR